MNLGGNILHNANTAQSSPSSSFSRDSGNGIFGEVVRPQLKGVSNYDYSNSYDRLSNDRFDKYGSGGGRSYGNSEYGGGLLDGKPLTAPLHSGHVDDQFLG